MHAPALLLVAAFTTAAPVRPETSPRAPENLLAGPARCVLRYLDAVRHAGPRIDAAAGRPRRPDEKDYAPVKKLTAPRALQEIARATARGEVHPLAPWREAARARVLESFQLLAARRAPRGAAVVTVTERYWSAEPDGPLERSVSEYLVARVGGEWRVLDRRPGGAFEESALADGYAGWFDEPEPAGAEGTGSSVIDAATEASDADGPGPAEE